MARKITIALLIIISYLLQTTYSSQISIGNITPNLLIIIVCIFALLRGRKEGLLIGFFAGLLPDLFYGYADITGFYSLVYMYLGYMIGFIHEIIYTDDIIIPVAFTAICDFLSNFAYYIIAFALRNKLQFNVYFKDIILPELIYTVFLTVFLYKLYKVINDILEEHERKREAKYGTGNIGNVL